MRKQPARSRKAATVSLRPAAGRALGLDLPATPIARADEVIE